MENNNNNRAVASLVLGLVSIVTWLFPIAGYITTILAIVFATKGRHSEKKVWRQQVWYLESFSW